MSQTPNISEAEWKVMQVLWQRSPLTAREVIQSLAAMEDWKPKTVKTLLNRLVSKRAITFTQDGRQYLYSPAICREECIRAEGQSFLNRVFGGAVRPMIAHFVEQADLTEDELQELQELQRILDAQSSHQSSDTSDREAP